MYSVSQSFTSDLLEGNASKYNEVAVKLSACSQCYGSSSNGTRAPRVAALLGVLQFSTTQCLLQSTSYPIWPLRAVSKNNLVPGKWWTLSILWSIEPCMRYVCNFQPQLTTLGEMPFFFISCLTASHDQSWCGCCNGNMRNVTTKTINLPSMCLRMDEQALQPNRFEICPFWTWQGWWHASPEDNPSSLNFEKVLQYSL